MRACSEKRMMVTALNNVDFYLFLVFSDLICRLEDAGVHVVWFHCATLICWTKFRSSNQEFSPSVGENSCVDVEPRGP